MATRAEIGSERGVWLLDMSILGRPFRFATQGVDVTKTDGEVLRYSPGLVDFDASRLDNGFSGEFGVRIEANVDWSELVARGLQLERSPVVIRRWYAGLTFERAQVFLGGNVMDVEYGSPSEGLELSVGAMPRENSDTVPPASSRVDTTTWPVRAVFLTDERIIGAGYPIVIGAPGHDDGGGAPEPVVPALAVEITPAVGASALLVAGHKVEAGTIRLHDLTDTPADSDATISEASDGLGRRISRILFSTTTITAAADGKWYTGWSLGNGGLEMNQGEGAVRGSMDVVRTILRRFGNVRLDVGRIQAEGDRLNQYKIDAYINSPVNAWDWVRSQIISLLPVAQLESDRGVWWRFLDWDATSEDAVAHLDADNQAVERSSTIRTGGSSIVNEITMEFGPVATSERYRKRRTVTADFGTLSGDIETSVDDRVFADYRCRQSQQLFGVRRKTFASNVLWDTPTAVRVLRDIAAAQAIPHRKVTYIGGEEFSTLEIGDVITLTDSEVFIADELALVSDIRIGQGPAVEIALTLLDNLGRRKKTT